MEALTIVCDVCGNREDDRAATVDGAITAEEGDEQRLTASPGASSAPGAILIAAGRQPASSGGANHLPV